MVYRLHKCYNSSNINWICSLYTFKGYVNVSISVLTLVFVINAIDKGKLILDKFIGIHKIVIVATGWVLKISQVLQNIPWHHGDESNTALIVRTKGWLKVFYRVVIFKNLSSFYLLWYTMWKWWPRNPKIIFSHRL